MFMGGSLEFDCWCSVWFYMISITMYETHTLLELGRISLSRSWTRLSVRHGHNTCTYDYIELCNFLKWLSVSTCVSVVLLCLCFIDHYFTNIIVGDFDYKFHPIRNEFWFWSRVCQWSIRIGVMVVDILDSIHLWTLYKRKKNMVLLLVALWLIAFRFVRSRGLSMFGLFGWIA
jgi:hypothetical protein